MTEELRAIEETLPSAAVIKERYRSESDFDVAVGGDDTRFFEVVTIPIVVTFLETIGSDGTSTSETEVEYGIRGPSFDEDYRDAEFHDLNSVGGLIPLAVREIREGDRYKEVFKLWRDRNAAYRRGLNASPAA